jgi:NitT/TauT family transport system permease protein
MRRITRNGRFSNYVHIIFMLVVVIIAWQVAITAFKIPTYLIPTPLRICSRFIADLPLLLNDIKVTSIETLLGLGVCILFSVSFSILIVWLQVFERALMPLLIFTQTIPLIAVIPILIIWFGVGITPKIITVFLLGFFQLLVLTISGLKSVEPEMIDLMRSMSASTYDIFRKVRFPASLPYIFDGMKLATILSLIGAVVAEMIGGDSGLGHVIVYAINDLHTDLLFVIIFLLSAMGSALFYLLVYLEKVVIFWHVAMRKEEFVRDVG